MIHEAVEESAKFSCARSLDGDLGGGRRRSDWGEVGHREDDGAAQRRLSRENERGEAEPRIQKPDLPSLDAHRDRRVRLGYHEEGERGKEMRRVL